MERIKYNGIELELDRRFMSEKMVDVIKEGRYERQEARQISRIIQADEIVLELGAGIGFVSALIAKNPLTKFLVSYEANPKLVPVIVDTLRRNVGPSGERWEVRNAVLMNGIVPDDVDFYLHEDFWASSLHPTTAGAGVEKVKAERFNHVLASLRPTLIVCDIEGGELDLFRNADLSGVKKVFLETHQKRLGRRGMKDLFDYFHARDFHYDQAHSEGSVVLFSHVDRDKR